MHPWWGAALRDWDTSLAVNRYLYVGVVALALALLGVWRRPAARRWGVVALGFGVLALGPTLRVGGEPVGVPLPYRLLAGLPLVRLSREPDRFDVLVTLALALMAAYGAQALLGVRRRPVAAAITLGLGALLVIDYLTAPILTRQPAQGVGGNSGVGRLRSLLQRTAGLPVEGGTGVKPYRVLHRRFIAEALLGDDMQQGRPLEFEHVPEGAQKMLEAMAVDRADVPES